MKYTISGFVLGIILALTPFSAFHSGFILTAEWHGNLESIDSIEPSPSHDLTETIPAIKFKNAVYLLKASGALLARFEDSNKIISPSFSGEYLATYEQAGKYIEFFNIKGDRFWKLFSLEYPFLTANAKIILLLNGDQSGIRVVDFNGNLTGCKNIFGRFCTTMYFPKNSDYSAIGFLDGNYYLLNEKGEIAHQGTVAQAMIKSLALSSNGNYLAVHYGWHSGDILRIIDVRANKFREARLSAVYCSKIPIHLNEEGYCTIIEKNKLLCFNHSIIPQFSINLPPSKEGNACIDFANGIYSITFPLAKGGALFMIVRKDGTIIFKKTFEQEDYLNCCLGNKFILVRGMKNLYCYRYENPATQ